MKVRELLDKPMDRKTFLRYLAVFFLASGGIFNFLKFFEDKDVSFLDNGKVFKITKSDRKHFRKQTKGYGSSSYGI